MSVYLGQEKTSKNLDGFVEKNWLWSPLRPARKNRALKNTDHLFNGVYAADILVGRPIIAQRNFCVAWWASVCSCLKPEVVYADLDYQGVDRDNPDFETSTESMANC